MKEITIFHSINNKWVKYISEDEGDNVRFTAISGFKRQLPPPYPGAPTPPPDWISDGQPPRVRTFPKDFLIHLARFYLRSAQPKVPPKFPWSQT